MSVRPDSKYIGTVEGGEWIESSKGTTGFQIDISTEDGPITHILWLTEKTQARFERDMATLGVTAEQLRSGSFLTYELGSAVVGRQIKLGTVEDVYKDKARTKVDWIGALNTPSTGRGTGYDVAAMFGGSEKAPAKVEDKPDTKAENLTDDDIPF